jgi:hypothetical protein
MPINPNALSGDPDRSAPPASAEEEGAVQAAQQDAADQDAAQEQTTKRKRRNKAEMIADAVVPADDEQVDLKDSGTGAKIQRPWLVALEMVRDGKAEFADKAMKYAMQKYDDQKAAAASEPEPSSSSLPFGGDGQDTPTSEPDNIPPEAEVGDEVRVGADTLRVGHGGVLTSGPISVDGNIVHPRRTWQRELGTGGKGPWEVVQTHPVPEAIQAETNGHGAEPPVAPAAIPAGVEIEQIAPGAWKVGTGILEKIGLPDYSSLQIGPVSASRVAIDDGRRTTVVIGDREASIPTAVVEVAREAMDIVEYIVRYQRGELVSFLESTGALKQPVS